MLMDKLLGKIAILSTNGISEFGEKYKILELPKNEDAVLLQTIEIPITKEWYRASDVYLAKMVNFLEVSI